MKKVIFSITLCVMAQWIYAGANTFPFALFERMQQENAENTIISPISLQQAIGMSANGATDATLSSLLDLTGDFSLAELNRRNQEDYTILNTYANDTLSHMMVSNSVWHMPSASLNKAFTDSVKQRYEALVDTANFGTQQGIDRVNSWVNDHTAKLINRVYEVPNPMLSISLINTTLFQGQWDVMYDAYIIKDQAFLNIDGTGSKVDMVRMQTNCRLYVEDDFAAVELTFSQEWKTSQQYSILIIMPRDPQNLVPFTAQHWSRLMAAPQNAYLDIWVPRFDLSCSCDMLPVLKKMGAFVPNDFSGISPIISEVTQIMHITRLKMDEKGVEAAAVTAMAYPTGTPEIPENKFVVDRPFFTAIMAKGVEEPVFMGRINKLDGTACEAPAPIVFSGVETTNNASGTTRKYIRGNQVLIEQNGKTYNVLGAEVK